MMEALTIYHSVEISNYPREVWEVNDGPLLENNLGFGSRVDAAMFTACWGNIHKTTMGR